MVSAQIRAMKVNRGSGTGNSAPGSPGRSLWEECPGYAFLLFQRRPSPGLICHSSTTRALKLDLISGTIFIRAPLDTKRWPTQVSIPRQSRGLYDVSRSKRLERGR